MRTKLWDVRISRGLSSHCAGNRLRIEPIQKISALAGRVGFPKTMCRVLMLSSDGAMIHEFQSRYPKAFLIHLEKLNSEDVTSLTADIVSSLQLHSSLTPDDALLFDANVTANGHPRETQHSKVNLPAETRLSDLQKFIRLEFLTDVVIDTTDIRDTALVFNDLDKGVAASVDWTDQLSKFLELGGRLRFLYGLKLPLPRTESPTSSGLVTPSVLQMRGFKVLQNESIFCREPDPPRSSVPLVGSTLGVVPCAAILVKLLSSNTDRPNNLANAGVNATSGKYVDHFHRCGVLVQNPAVETQDCNNADMKTTPLGVAENNVPLSGKHLNWKPAKRIYRRLPFDPFFSRDR